VGLVRSATLEFAVLDFTPKKTKPFQRVPVMVRAISESER